MKIKTKTIAKTAKSNETSNLEAGLYVVSTPIGNSLDWTFRAEKVLSLCDVIAAEDTRTTKTALEKLGIKAKKIVSYHEHNEDDSAAGLLKLLIEGKSVALVSDAGTPQINDPGFKIVRLAYEKGIKVIPVPGVSSLTAALSISPLGGGTCYFAGFLPSQAKARQDYLKQIKSVAHQIIFFEAPHRIKETMDDLEFIFGPINEVLVCRELTKSFEEISLKTIGEARKYSHVSEPRGEFVIIVKGQPAPKLNREETKANAKKLFEQGYTASSIVENLQPVSELTRKEIYDMVLSIKKI